MRILGETKRTPEALSLLRSLKTNRTVRYQPRNKANEHIDRIIDAYDNGTLDVADTKLLQMVAPHAYDKR
jgi:hypothetical protein